MKPLKSADTMAITVVLLAAIFLLILFSDAVIPAVSHALSVCGSILLPTLFPFLILSSLLVRTGGTKILSKMAAPVLKPLFRIRGEGAAAWVIGILCGYPVGAKAAADLYAAGKISRDEAQSLVGFCNNAGPVFIIGAVGVGMLADQKIGILLYIIHIAASVTLGICSRFTVKNLRLPPKSAQSLLHNGDIFTESVEGAVKTLLSIFGYVIFFAVIMAILEQMHITDSVANLLCQKPSAARLICSIENGILELTCGIRQMVACGAPIKHILPLLSFLLGWAGFSVHFQTRRFLTQCGLSFPRYLLSKLLHGCISCVYCIVLLPLFPCKTEAEAFAAFAKAPARIPFFSVCCIILVCVAILLDSKAKPRYLTQRQRSPKR